MDFLRCLCGGFCLLRSCISRRCFTTLCFSGGLCCSLAAAVGFLLTWYSHSASSRLYCSTTERNSHHRAGRAYRQADYGHRQKGQAKQTGQKGGRKIQRQEE